MSGVERPTTPQEALAHFGKKGMKWGITNDETSGSGSRFTPGQKKALRIGAGVALTAGALAVTTILAKNGNISVSSIPSNLGTAGKFAVNNKHGVSTYGSYAIKAFEAAAAV